ncbi:metal ABC transporter solute-binding protein, Zn/Mn family [Salinicola avicenniae]|uniref:metal ABC transporter solute-binding protein, Zn/Mn family n=1 Tax=Salinicola avicenniae TaxID=2916836 RepID=UPI002072C64D|nr:MULTISPECIES: zinc ABC transporter substrate-binding protein [unclassified Salinicola]
MSHVPFRALLTGALGASALLAGSAQAQAPLQIVTSFSILDDMVETVGGEHVRVDSLVGPNGDAHAFSPSPADAQSLADADLVVVNGLQLEGWIDRLIDASGYEGDVVVASDGIETRAFSGHEDEHADHAGDHDAHDEHHDDHDEHHDDHGEHHDDHGHDHAEAEGHHHHHGGVDPHAWQDLENAEQYVRNIRDALVELDPDNAEDYRTNAEQYLEEMQALDASAQERLGQIPESDRLIITSHDAFGYLADAYGLKMLSPVGINTLSEPSASDMGALIQQIEESHARALFIENMTNPALINQLHEETDVAIGGELYADALTPEGEGSTYLGMFRHNVDTLVEALAEKE